VEERYCSYCGSKLDLDARFCWNCGRPVHRGAREPAPEVDMPTSQIPTSPQPTSPPPLPPQQLREMVARGGTTWHRAVVARGGISWQMLALAVVFLILAVGEAVQGGLSGAIRAVPLVAAVVLVGSVVSYLSLVRRNGGATLREAVFNWSVAVLAAFAAFLFLIS
jgi:zinc-ribbon domain